jgi:hypothetical protein
MEPQEQEEEATAQPTQAPTDPDETTAVAEEGTPPEQVPPELPPLTTEEGADLDGYQLTPADKLLDSVLGDHVHANDGRHLTGGVTDDRRWQSRWMRMVQISPTRYSVPKGTVG